MSFNLNDVIKIESKPSSNTPKSDNNFNRYNHDYKPTFAGENDNSVKKKYVPKKFNEEIAEQNKQSYYFELPKRIWPQIPKGSMIRYVDKDGYFSYGGFVLEQNVGQGKSNPYNKGKRYIRLKSPKPGSKPWTIWLHEVQRIFEKQKPGTSTPSTAKILQSMGVDTHSGTNIEFNDTNSMSSNNYTTHNLDMKLENLNLKNKVERLDGRLKIFEEAQEKRVKALENAVKRMYMAITKMSKKIQK